MDDNNTSASVDTAPVTDTNVADSAEETESQQEAKDSTQQPAEKKAEVIKNLKKYKVKVDGQDFEEEIDLNDDEVIKRHIQMSRAAQKRMSEAARIRKEAEDVIGMFKGDLKSVFKHADKLGKTPEKLREEIETYFAEIIQEEMLSPEQKTIKEAQRIIREREDETKKATAEQEAREQTELQNRYAQDYDKKITDALSSSGLPKTTKTVKRMADLMYKNLNMGLDLEPQHLVQLVREDYLNEIKELFGATDGDTLLKLLGDDVANKIRRSDLARLKTPKPPTKIEQAPPREEQPRKRMSTEEWMAEVRKRAQS